MAACAFSLLAGSLHAGAQLNPSASSATAGALLFDLAAVHEDKPDSGAGEDSPESNVPLGPGNVYSPTGGVFKARNIPLIRYIAFAYKMTDAQLASLKAAAPDWVSDERFSIEAHTEKADVSKDELRLMMRSLLHERFHLALHGETKQIPVYALMLVRPPQTGPRLQIGKAQGACPTVVPGKDPHSSEPPSETVAGGFPYTCGGIILLAPSAPNLVKIGARNLSMALLVNSLTSWGQLSRPLIDRTGLTAEVSFVLEYLPDPGPAATGAQPLDAAMDGPNFRTALKQQLGLKLEPEKGNVDVVVLDHIDHVTPN